MTKTSFKPYGIVSLIVLLICGLYAPPANAATIVDAQGVIYDITTNTETTKEVTVSSQNASKFASTKVDIVIPLTVTDTSTNKTDGEFTVTKIASSAFKNTAITSLTIEAPITSVPYGMCYGCSNLQTVELPTTVTTVGSYAFYNCTSLETVNGFDNVSEVESSGFEGCSLLTSLDTNVGLTTVSYNAFYNCSKIENVKLAEGLKTIDKYAFYGCSSLKWPELPSTVTEIREYAFDGCSSLGDIKLVSGMEIRGQNTFANTYITSITWPEEAIKFTTTYGYVAKYSFANITGLTELNFPEWFKVIPNYTFSGCTDLCSINFPETMTSIGSYAFKGCSSLTSVTLPAEVNMKEQVFSGCDLTELIIPDKPVGTWSSNAIGQQNSITSMTFPASMTQIPNQICYYWRGLKEITFEGTVSIGSSAFYNCSALTEISFPESLKTIGKGAFDGCNNLSSVKLNSGLETIESHAFYKCSNLQNIEFPLGLKTIGSYSFQYTGLTSVKLIPDVDVGNYAFANNSSLASIIFPESPCSFGAFSFSSNSLITSITFPEWMTAIPNGFCAYWSVLESVNFGTQVTEVGDYAFYRCYKLSLNEDISDVDLSKILKFGKYSFADCSSTSPKFIENLTLADGAIIGDHAFDGAAVYAITFEGCAEFGADILKSNKYISSIKFPECMTEIPDGFCSGWSKLTRVVLPPEVTKIGKECFYNCNITGIRFDSVDYDYSKDVADVEEGIILLPSTITEIGDGAFRATKISSVEWPEREITLGAYTLAETLVTEGTFPTWMETVPEYMYYSCKKLTSITWSDNIKELGKYNFYGCSNLNGEITLPDAITYVPYSCFQSCSKLTGVIIGPNVTYLDSYAFQASRLKSIDIPGNVTTIKSYCFNNCTSLEEVTLNEGLTRIEDNNAFSYSAVKHITFPTTLSYVGYTAFYNCKSLETVVSNADNLVFGRVASSWVITPGKSEVFRYCTKLKTFETTKHIDELPSYLFADCTSLTNIIYNAENNWFNYIYNYAFFNCKALEEFPYLKKTKWFTYYNDNYAFQNCSNLVQMIMPEIGLGVSYYPLGYLSGATSLQSIIFPYTGDYFKIVAEDIESAPLKALSYSYASGISTNKGNTYGMVQYTGNNSKTVASPETSILYVVRGEKWKYMEAGYGELFDIREMKDPQIDINGDLFSVYDADKNVNHYTVSLRWPMMLSDFNENGETKVHVYRSGNINPDEKELVAEIVFSKPSEPKALDGVDADQVIEVSYTVNGEENTFVGDFIIPSTDSDGVTTYQMTQANCGPTIYYNADTSKRLNTFDYANSWFAFVDKFDSPVLSEPGVPTEYIYTAVMDGYEYDLLVNNDDLRTPVIDEDGTEHYYHTERATFETATSQSPKMVVPIAIPTVKFDGVYSLEEIYEDYDHDLTVTPSHNDRTYQLGYTLDEELAFHKGTDSNSSKSEYIITSVDFEELDPETNEKLNTTTITLSTVASSRSNTGTVSLPSSKINIGSKFQTVTNTTFRGTFGSPVLTIPDVPTLSGSVSLGLTEHFWELWGNVGHGGWMSILAAINLKYNFSDIGYNKDNSAAFSDDYRLALWRKVENNTNIGSEELVYFLGEDPVTVYSDGAFCTDCAAEAGFAESRFYSSSDELNYADTFRSESGSTGVIYKARIYAKVAESMLRDDDTWMIAEVDLTNQAVIAGIDDIKVDSRNAEKDGIWYDLQGRRVDQPISGTPYIRVTSSGAAKAIYR